MTQSTFLADTLGSESAFGKHLLAAVKQQIANEKVSFHTPGHKGRLSLDIAGSLFTADLTELPGLDELANARGVIQSLQTRIAKLWQARQSLISVNGASAALCAAILACANRGGEILLPRNIHRSALNALVLSGLDPIWYEPEWLSDWGTWGKAADDFESAIVERKDFLAAAVICSPSYAGQISDRGRLAAICKANDVALIVDEAHGAHLLREERLYDGTIVPAHSLEYGADLVIHSLHKTLGAPTQTGVLHTSATCTVSDEAVKASLNMLQSSSPSYLLMLGIEKSIDELEDGAVVKSLQVASQLRERLAKIPGIELLGDEETTVIELDGQGDARRRPYNEQQETEHTQIDPLHILLRHREIPADLFHQALCRRGIYAEAILGNGVLLLLGTGSTISDIDCLIDSLKSINEDSSTENQQSRANQHSSKRIPKPFFSPQFMNPRKAFFCNSLNVPLIECEGKIACDWIAPCPPGYPILAPGQRITRELIESLKTDSSIRVVKHLEGDSDGPNPTSR